MRVTATGEQVEVLRLLADQVRDSDAYLAGGVAVAARFGHRTSLDLDLFTKGHVSQTLIERVSALPGSRILSRSADTLRCTISGLPVSILQYDYALLRPPELVAEYAIPLASLDDLLCMKLSALANRGALRDFWDVDELLGPEQNGLGEALALYGRKYPVEDVGHVVRSLVYFADADSEPRPPQLGATQWAAIKQRFLRRVRTFASPSPRPGRSE